VKLQRQNGADSHRTLDFVDCLANYDFMIIVAPDQKWFFRAGLLQIGK